MVKFKKLTAADGKTPAEADSAEEAGTKIDRQEADMALMDRAQIMEIIPHRDPFLLIDEIESRRMRKKARLPRLNMSGNQNTISKDIFPSESYARRAHRGSSGPGRATGSSREKFRGKLAFFGGIKNAKFRSQVTPGDTLRLHVEMEKLGSRAGTARGTAVILPGAGEPFGKTCHSLSV